MSGEDPRVEVQALLENAASYNEWIASQARPHIGQRLLDAGAGSGNVTSLLLDRELVVAVDEWPEFVELMDRRAQDHDNLVVYAGDISDPEIVEPLRGHDLDSAVCLNVLEHVPDDVGALRNIAAVLPPGGVLFLLVPAFPLLYGEMDRADHHLRRYTRRSLRRTVAETPFEIQSLRYMNLPGFFAWFLYARILRRPLVPAGSYRAYDRFVPLLRRVERRIPPPFGQSLLAVLRKQGT